MLVFILDKRKYPQNAETQQMRINTFCFYELICDYLSLQNVCNLIICLSYTDQVPRQHSPQKTRRAACTWRGLSEGGRGGGEVAMCPSEMYRKSGGQKKSNSNYLCFPFSPHLSHASGAWFRHKLTPEECCTRCLKNVIWYNMPLEKNEMFYFSILLLKV